MKHRKKHYTLEGSVGQFWSPKCSQVTLHAVGWPSHCSLSAQGPWAVLLGCTGLGQPKEPFLGWELCDPQCVMASSCVPG